MTDPLLRRARASAFDRSRSGSGKQFPSDLLSDQNGKAMKFNFYTYRKPTHDGLETETPIGTVSLYMPPQLASQDSLSYNDFDGGLEYSGYLGARSLIEGAYNAIGENRNPFADQSAESVMGAAGSVAGAAGLAALNTIAGKYADIASVELGKTLNPRVLSKFERVGFKTYQFTWLMVAKNEEESEAIRQIVHEFRKNAHPTKSTSGAFLNYPSLVTFEYLPSELNDWLWKPNPCAITAVNVEYTSSGTPKFFKDTQAPVECILSVQLKEMIVDTRENIEEKYNG